MEYHMGCCCIGILLRYGEFRSGFLCLGESLDIEFFQVFQVLVESYQTCASMHSRQVKTLNADLFGQQYCWNSCYIGPIAIPSYQKPPLLTLIPMSINSPNLHMHNSNISPHPIKQKMTKIQQFPRMPRQIHRQPQSNQPRGHPNSQVKQFTFYSSMEVYIAYSIFGGEDIEVGVVHVSHQSVPHARVILGVGVLPPVFRLAEDTVGLDWLAHVAHYSFCCCLASPCGFLAWAESIIYAFDFSELGQEFVNDSRGQAWRSTRSCNSSHTLVPGFGMIPQNSANIIPAIRKINIIDPSLNTILNDLKISALEGLKWPTSINHNFRPITHKIRFQIFIYIQDNSLDIRDSMWGDVGLELGLVLMEFGGASACDCYGDVLGEEGFGDHAAEVAVTSQNHCSICHSIQPTDWQ